MKMPRYVVASLLVALSFSEGVIALQGDDDNVIIQLNALPAAKLQPAAAATNLAPEPAEPSLAPSESPGIRSSILKFANGDFLFGELVDSPKEHLIGWKCPAFANVLEIYPGSLASLDQQNTELDVEFNSGFSFRTHDGELLWGVPKSWNEESIDILTPNFGVIRMRPNSIRFVTRLVASEKVLYQEPFHLAKWKSADLDAWSIESGSLVCRKLGSRVIGATQLAEKCQIQLGLSWVGKPNFVIALGVPEDAKNSGKSFSIEVWDDKLALLRELPMRAEAAFLQTIDAKTTSVELTVYLDQIAGRAVVFSNEGKLLADIKLTSQQPESHPFLSVENFCREIRLDQVRVLSWSGEIPIERDGTADRFELVDGRVIDGKMIGFAEDRGWTIRTAEGDEIQVATEELRSLVLSPISNDGKESTDTRKKQLKSSVSTIGWDTGALDLARIEPFVPGELKGYVLLRNQTRLLGTWQFVRDGELQFHPTSAHDSVRIPLSEIISFRAVQRSGKQSFPSTDGMMLSDNVQLRGKLLDSEEVASPTVFRWSSPFLESPAAIASGVEGRFDFRRLEGLSTNASTPYTPQVGVIRGQAFQVPVGSASQRRVHMPNVRLRSGERFMAEVDQIDERGLFFHNSSTAKGFVPHDLIHSVEMKSIRRETPVDSKKFERFLTVPRMRRDDPPTHALISLNGDYLRGRLIHLAGEEVVMEINLSETRIPISAIAQVVWLHDRNWSSPKPSSPESATALTETMNEADNDVVEELETSLTGANFSKAADPEPAEHHSTSSRIHVSERAGWSLNLEPLRVTSGILVGKHSILGEYAVDLKGVELILFGGNIESRANRLIENPWTLSLAKIPKVFEDAERESDEGEQPIGEDSQLVGKPAPKLEGEMLDGSKFVLAEHKGKIVVLDFWASWCGPCMQYMPLLDAAIDEIGNPDVELFAVNLEESSDRAAAAMNRLKLDTQVVLDIDGVAGQRYEANAIPQTVIVDREGNVRYVFVGGGAQTVSQIRTAIEKLLNQQTGT